MDLKLGKYRHFKGGEYELLAIAKHSETLEELVVYVNETDPALVWARPISMWSERVGDGLRFTLLGDRE